MSPPPETPADGPNALDGFFLNLYPDLRRMAHSRLFRNEHMTLLDTTSLVHEAYLRLRGASLPPEDRPSEVLALVASVMRSVIVDSLRRRHAARRGGGREVVEMDSSIPPSAEYLRAEQEAIEVDGALTTLAEADSRLALIVEMKYYGGFTEAEIAQCLGISERTARREWNKARALLKLALSR
jgi:RNA polymerase sigma factor (TIGR02999 family)